MSNTTALDRVSLTAKLREKHQPVFDALGESDAKFCPKMFHYVSGLEGLHLGFFESELKHGKDVYTEKIDRNWESEDPDRILYRYRANEFFRDELAQSEPNEKGTIRYFVPADELEVVEMPSKPVVKRGRPPKKAPIDSVVKTVEKVMNDDDIPLSELTARDLIAIMTGKPVSNKPLINQLLTEDFKI